MRLVLFFLTHFLSTHHESALSNLSPRLPTNQHCTGTPVAIKRCPHGSLVATITDAAPNILQLWSTINMPTFMLVSFTTPAKLPSLNFIDCANPTRNITSLLGDLIVNYSYATLVPYLIEFDDSKGSGEADPSTPMHHIALNNQTQWNLTLAADNSSATFTSAFVQLQVFSHNTTGRDSYNPYLLFDPKSTSVAVTISNYAYNL